MHQLYLAKGALATTAIEGNTLSESEVLRVLTGELKLPPSREYLKQEIDNVAEAFNKIYRQIQEGFFATFQAPAAALSSGPEVR